MEIFRKIFAAVGGMASCISGLCWYSSANLQLTVIHSSTPNSDKLVKILEISAQHNLWAAEFAVLAGATLATAAYS